MQKINFQNLPSTSTPINATNLNAIQSNVEDVFNGTEPMGNIVVDSIRSKNMFNVLTCISGGINNSTGQPEAFDMATITNKNANNGSITFETSYDWKGIISEYIEVEENKVYTISFTTTENTMLYMAWFYDDNKNYLSNYTFTLGVSITMPNNAKYVRFLLETTNATSLPATITLSNIQFEKGSSATSFSPYQELDNQENYSLSEQKIGTWINGKPLYRKVIQGTTADGDVLIDLNYLNIETLTNFSGSAGSNFDYKPINFDYFGYSISTRYSLGTMYVNASTPYANIPFNIIIEYTKTTD